MNRIVFIAILLTLFTQTGFATTWHVSGTGNDANDGKSEKTAFRSLQKAADRVEPGDVVLIGNDTYTNDDKGNNSATERGPVLNITRSGTSNAWITWKARPGHTPEVRPVDWCGIQISGSYNVIDGLTVMGNNDSIVLLHAQEDAKKQRPIRISTPTAFSSTGETISPTKSRTT